MLTLAGVSQRLIIELMRYSDMRLTAKTYTDAGMLPTGDAVMMCPSLSTGCESDSQIDSQKLVASGLLLSRPVQVLETANVAETLINRGFEADLSHAVPVCPKGEMVRDAGSNLQGGVLHQGLAEVAPQLAPQGRGWPGEVEEIAAAWAKLPGVLKAAILGIVRSARWEDGR